MTDGLSADLVGIVVEGATDRFCGRPRAMNPYCATHAAGWCHAWLWGWDDADWLLRIRGQEEARRWLEQAA